MSISCLGENECRLVAALISRYPRGHGDSWVAGYEIYDANELRHMPDQTILEYG
jgi:hypothetical protein